MQGDGQIKREDLLVGDVWIASGQSNMEIPLRGFGPSTPIGGGPQAIAAAHDEHLRLLVVARRSSELPQQNIEGAWSLCTPQTAADFSAVAYFFGREIQQEKHVPIGLIDATWGGTPADAWLSLDTLGSNPALLPAFQARAQFAEQQAELGPRYEIEKREDEALRAAGRFAPQHPWRPAQESWIPAALFNGMIAPLTRFAISGVIWYQGESNSGAGRENDYAALFSALISDWRMHFGQGDFPFLFVQISSADVPKEHWGIVRDAQRRALSLRNTAMAVSLDVGDQHNVHPPDKQTVAHRLALSAAALRYGSDVPYQGPLPREVSVQKQALQVWFDHANGLTTRGKPLEGFEVAGKDHHFVEASATINGDSVLVSNPKISNPVYVRYLWANFPPAPLYNSAGLPAATFSTEWFPRVDRSDD